MTEPCRQEEAIRVIYKKLDRLNAINSFRVAFWVMAAMFTVVIPSLIAGVIQNDRIRAEEDQRISREASIDRSSLRALLNDKLTTLAVDVREIKTELKMRGA